jgi:hypothetical protein
VPAAKKSKYRAVRTGGYASKFEAKVAAELKSKLLPGETLIEQVPIKFACGAKYVCDFAVSVDGKIVRYVEAKGMVTPIWKLKMRMLRHEHPEIAAALTVISAAKKKGKKREI